MPATPVRYVVYARKSPGESKGLSIPVQTEWGLKEGQRRDFTLAQDLGVTFRRGVQGDKTPGVYVDEGAHGGRLKVRGGLWRMLEDGRAGRFRVLTVYRTDRLSRSEGSGYYIAKALKQFGIRVLSTDNPDGSDLIPKFSRVIAESEVETLRQRTRDALARVRKEKVLGRRPKGFVGDGLDYKPIPDALALFKMANGGAGEQACVESPYAIRLKVRNVYSLRRLMSNIRAWNHGRLAEKLDAQRPAIEERKRRLDEEDSREERELAHRLIDLVPDLRR